MRPPKTRASPLSDPSNSNAQPPHHLSPLLLPDRRSLFESALLHPRLHPPRAHSATSQPTNTQTRGPSTNKGLAYLNRSLTTPHAFLPLPFGLSHIPAPHRLLTRWRGHLPAIQKIPSLPRQLDPLSLTLPPGFTLVRRSSLCAPPPPSFTPPHSTVSQSAPPSVPLRLKVSPSLNLRPSRACQYPLLTALL